MKEIIFSYQEISAAGVVKGYILNNIYIKETNGKSSTRVEIPNPSFSTLLRLVLVGTDYNIEDDNLVYKGLCVGKLCTMDKSFHNSVYEEFSLIRLIEDFEEYKNEVGGYMSMLSTTSMTREV